MTLHIVVMILLLGKQTCADPDSSPPLEMWNGPSYREIQGHPDALDALEGLFHELESMGNRPVVISGYRSYEYQTQLHDKSPEWTEPPGCSQHQLGTAFDIGWMGYGLRSPHDHELWPLLEKVGLKHDFEVTYDGAGDIPAEPWHLNYVGKVDRESPDRNHRSIGALESNAFEG